MKTWTVVLTIIAALTLYAWGTEPPAGAPRPTGTGEVDSRGAVAFCALARRPETGPDVALAYSNAEARRHPLLASLALQWGSDGSAGAREQVLVQCEREGLS